MVARRSDQLQRALQGAAALALGGALVWGAVHFTRAGWEQYPTDFKVYHDAIVRFVAGQSVYDRWALAADPFGPHFKYHRVFLFSLLPLAGYRLEAAADIWRAATLLAFAASAALIIAERPRRERLPLALVAALICANFAPLKQTVRLGQADALFLLALVAALAGHANRAVIPGAFGWAMLGLVKLYHYQTLLLLPLLVAAGHALGRPERAPLLLLAYALLAFGAAKQLRLDAAIVPGAFVLTFVSYRLVGVLLLWGWWLRWWAEPEPSSLTEHPTALREEMQ